MLVAMMSLIELLAKAIIKLLRKLSESVAYVVELFGKQRPAILRFGIRNSSGCRTFNAHRCRPCPFRRSISCCPFRCIRFGLSATLDSIKKFGV
jgi:hypothetical protein